MPSYTLEIEAYSNFTTNAPTLEVWADGTLNSSFVISSDGSSISLTLSYGGALPSSLEFTFNDGFAANGRTIEIRSVMINDRYVNVGNYLSADSLTKGQTATMDIASANTTDSDFLFDSNPPAASEFTTGATHTYTPGNDTHREYLDATPKIFDMLGGRDVAYLGSGNDKVSGGAGNDILYGRGGDDLIYGDEGDDSIFGGDGTDRLYGGNGNDRIHGEAGNDEIHGGDGADRLHGHGGDDVITGGLGDDRITGGVGNDFLFGDAGNDQIVGAQGDDTIDGGAGDDIIYGGAGIDHINGGADNDVLIGNAGDDIMHGNSGNDLVLGLGDNDTLYGGLGHDILFGGDGNDHIVGGSGNDIIDAGDGNDMIIAGPSIGSILASNPNVHYSSVTGSFYEYVNTPVFWNDANVAAQNATLASFGTGSLANITSQEEQDFIWNTVLNSGSGVTFRVFIGGSEESEGDWRWRGGNEDNLQFSSGSTPVGGFYTNWGGGNPNNSGGNQQYLALQRNAAGQWDDLRDANGKFGYVIEWDGTLDNDTVSYATATGAITLDLSLTGPQDTKGSGIDTISNVENIIGSAFNDTLLGNDDANIIEGGIGKDLIYGDGISPNAIAGNVLWLDASDRSTILDAEGDDANSGGAFSGFVSTWLDKSGSNNNATGTAATLSDINGKTTIHFTNDTMIVGNVFGSSSNSESHIFAVFQENFRSDDWLFDFNSYSSNFRFHAPWNDGYIYFDAPKSDRIRVLANSVGDVTQMTASHSVSDGYNALHIDDNSRSVFSGSANPVPVSGGLVIGQQSINHELAELIVFDRRLSASEEDIIEKYLMDKWKGTNLLPGGADTFVLDDNSVDDIMDFSTMEGDALDISNILDGYVDGVSAITDFVQITDSGSNSIVSVDADGTVGGTNFTQVATLYSVTGLTDEAALEVSGNLILA